MRKIVYASTLSAFAFFASAAVLALPKTTQSYADEGIQPPSHTTNFIAPNSYEEYLKLTAPTATAVSATHTAIADGNVIYLYDRAHEQYQAVEFLDSYHQPQTVKNLQFCAEDGNLYFTVDSEGENFYKLNPNNPTYEKSLNIACEQFVIHGTSVYFANVSGTLLCKSLTEQTPAVELLSETNPTNPLLAFWNDELYFTDNSVSQRLFKVSPQTRIPTPVADFSDRAQSLTINAGVLAFTTFSGDFYAYTLPSINEESLLTHQENGAFTALYSFGDYIYATQKTLGAVQQYSITDKAFTDYEIASSSNSLNRLNGATTTEISGDLLFIADNSNKRISIYNVQSDTFLTPLSTELAPTYIAASENTLLLANKDKAELYDISVYTQENAVESTPAPTLLQTFDNFQGEIVGVTDVYDRYYFITSGYAYALEKSEESGEWERIETKKNCTSFVAPKLFTSNIYGDLFISTGNFVFTFKESEFMQEDTSGLEICSTLPAATTKIAVDYNGDLYALSENKIYQFLNTATTNTTTPNVFDFSTPKVYAQSVEITSFAFGVEENSTYLLCDQNYILQTNALGLPTVKTIAISGANDEIFSQNQAEFSLVEVQKDAITIAFDFHAFQNASVFPYLSYQRETAAFTALELEKTDDYSIIAVYHLSENSYTTHLVKSAYCTPIPKETYQKTYTPDEQKTGYLTNALPLFKYPFLTDLLTVENLERGTTVTLIGEINQLDHEYYQITFQNETGAIQTGYIPKSYITFFNGTPPTPETSILGETESDQDMLWRLGYILLGFIAIGVLSDWLLLRKKQDE